MKKVTKKLIAAMALVLICAVCFAYGCASDPGDSGKTQTPAGNNATAAPATSGTSDDNGYVFKHGDVTVIMNAPAADIIAALGTPRSYYEEPSCAFEGMDKTYSYGSFDVTTYTEGGADYISGVVLWDDSVETPEGLYIGAKAADVTKAYGVDAAGKTNVSVTRGKSNIIILLKDDTVTSIQYLAIY
ncbi:MAG: hypothetical protein J5950_01075 [Clostridia bacterium]|nr:hypothetical protein [Clostridia bacterium]